MANCCCCGDDLTFGEKKKRRRPLSKSSMQGIVQTLASLVCMESNVSDIDIPKLHTGYLCRNCLELLERYQSLQQQLRSTIKAALPTLPKTAYEYTNNTAYEYTNKAAKTAYEYTREVLSLGLLFLNFKDAVREGDGDRVLLMWKYFMLIFKASGCKNYAAEAFSLLSQYHITLPPNLAEQLKWSRFVNIHGLKGHNISCDQHMNRQIQSAVGGLGANKTPKAIIRVGKAIGVLSSVTESFDVEVGVATPSGKHSEESMQKDLKKIVVSKIFLQNIAHPTTHSQEFNIEFG